MNFCIRAIVAVILFITGIALSIWFSVFFLLIGGIIQAIKGFSADPILVTDAAVGIVRFILGWATGGLMIFLNIMWAGGPLFWVAEDE